VGTVTPVACEVPPPGDPHAAVTAATSPLAPLDTSSPRATLRSFCDTVDRIFANLISEERTLALQADNRHRIQQAFTCLDMSAIAPTLVDSEGRQAIVCLKEVLDRIELPNAVDIPDAAAAKADGETVERKGHYRDDRAKKGDIRPGHF
jgi:MscS family membrane protein